MIKYNDGYWEDIEKIIKYIPNLKNICGKTILVTGSTGMICSSLVDVLLYLNKRYNSNVQIILAGRSLQRICDRFYNFENEKDFIFEFFDATADTEINVKADYIIHGASNANPGNYTKEPVETILANITGLNHLLSMAVKQKSERLLYISSSEVYGQKEVNRPYKEDDYGFVNILNQRACYPNAKRTAETLCIAYGQEFGLHTVIVRPGYIYGPSITDTDNRASAEFTRDAACGRDIVLKSAGQQLRSYCYTLDCASAILAVLLNGLDANAYNISNKNSVVTIHDVAEELAKSVGKKVIYQNASEDEKIGYNLMTNSSLNSEKLEALGWRAIFDLKSGISSTLKYYTVN